MGWKTSFAFVDLSFLMMSIEKKQVRLRKTLGIKHLMEILFIYCQPLHMFHQQKNVDSSNQICSCLLTNIWTYIALYIYMDYMDLNGWKGSGTDASPPFFGTVLAVRIWGLGQSTSDADFFGVDSNWNSKTGIAPLVEEPPPSWRR